MSTSGLFARIALLSVLAVPVTAVAAESDAPRPRLSLGDAISKAQLKATGKAIYARLRDAAKDTYEVIVAAQDGKTYKIAIDPQSGYMLADEPRGLAAGDKARIALVNRSRVGLAEATTFVEQQVGAHASEATLEATGKHPAYRVSVTEGDKPGVVRIDVTSGKILSRGS